jgi:hypothetical protein
MLELGIFQTLLTNSDCKQFQSLVTELISLRIQINSWEEANKAAQNFSASTVLAYRLSTNKITLLDLNKDPPGMRSLLKHKRRLKKLWQITPDPACKTAVIGSPNPSDE